MIRALLAQILLDTTTPRILCRVRRVCLTVDLESLKEPTVRPKQLRVFLRKATAVASATRWSLFQ